MIPSSIRTYRAGLEQSLDSVLKFMETRLKSDLMSINVESVSGRKKSAESIQQKLQAGRFASASEVRDLVGITVVVLFRREIPEALQLARDSGLVVEDPGLSKVPPSDFRYREPKLYMRPPDTYLRTLPEAADLVCEVQFTTALQHALDKATHDFDYKGSVYSWQNFRLVAQMRGILEMVDRSIDNLDAVDSSPDPTVSAPEEMDRAIEVLAVLEEIFSDRLPADRRRFADTVSKWISAAEMEVADLGPLLLENSDLLNAASLDPTSVVLGAMLRTSAPLVENFDGYFLISNELDTLCVEAERVPSSRRVSGL